MRQIWGNGVNLSVGVYSKTSMKLSWLKNIREWYDDTGNFGTTGATLGLIVGESNVEFFSYKKSEVDKWTLGALSVMKLLRGCSNVRLAKDQGRKLDQCISLKYV